MILRIVSIVRQGDDDDSLMTEAEPLHVLHQWCESGGRSGNAAAGASVPNQGGHRVEGTASEVSRMRAEIDELQARLAASEARLAKVEGRLQRILGSRSYRLARKLAGAKRRVATLVGVGNERVS